MERSEYEDQHGIKHKCWEVKDEVEVTFTGQYHTYQYYDTTVKNPIHSAPDGRTWVQMVPTDYGGVSSYSRRENEVAIIGEIWIRDYGHKSYGLYPIVRKEI